MSDLIPKIAARVGIALTTVIGGGSLALLGAFLFLGPFGLVELGLSPGGQEV